MKFVNNYNNKVNMLSTVLGIDLSENNEDVSEDVKRTVINTLGSNLILKLNTTKLDTYYKTEDFFTKLRGQEIILKYFETIFIPKNNFERSKNIIESTRYFTTGQDFCTKAGGHYYLQNAEEYYKSRLQQRSERIFNLLNINNKDNEDFNYEKYVYLNYCEEEKEIYKKYHSIEQIQKDVKFLEKSYNAANECAFFVIPNQYNELKKNINFEKLKLYFLNMNMKQDYIDLIEEIHFYDMNIFL